MVFHLAALQVTYKWESLDGWSGIPAGNYTLKNLVLPPPVPAEAGQTYNLRLTARFTGSTAAATANVALTAVGSPLSASLVGPSGDVMGDREVVLDASKSLDPDDPKVRPASCYVVCLQCHRQQWMLHACMQHPLHTCILHTVACLRSVHMSVRPPTGVPPVFAGSHQPVFQLGLCA
jgi:hypothetical protein